MSAAVSMTSLPCQGRGVKKKKETHLAQERLPCMSVFRNMKSCNALDARSSPHPRIDGSLQRVDGVYPFRPSLGALDRSGNLVITQRVVASVRDLVSLTGGKRTGLALLGCRGLV
jgi:hypothetical protein